MLSTCINPLPMDTTQKLSDYEFLCHMLTEFKKLYEYVRNLQLDFINDTLNNVLNYGLKNDGITDNSPIFQKVLEEGNKVFIFPAGEYLFSTPVDLNSSIVMKGSGIDNTVLLNFSAICNMTEGAVSDLTFKSPNKSVFTGIFVRTAFTRCKFTNYNTALDLNGYENLWLSECEFIEADNNVSTCIIVGGDEAFNTGSNLFITNCFLRGNLNKTGIKVQSAEAIFMTNTDIGGFYTDVTFSNFSHRSNNNFFTQCFFDATYGGNCFEIIGSQLTDFTFFSNCWFASAGKNASGNSGNGLYIGGSGIHVDINISNCVFFNNSVNGIYLDNTTSSGTISNCDFNANANIDFYSLQDAPPNNLWTITGGLLNSIYAPKAFMHIYNIPNIINADLSLSSYVELPTLKYIELTLAATNLDVPIYASVVKISGSGTLTTIPVHPAGKILHLYLNGNINITNAGNIKVTDFLIGGAGSAIMLTRIDDEWHELSRIVVAPT